MLKNEWKDAKDMAVCFKAYLFRNRYVILIMGIFVFLVHGSKLFSLNNGIDTEQIIFLGNEFYESWLGIGRQGLIFLKWLLGLEVYNPFFAPVLLMIFSVTAFIAYTFLLEYAGGECGFPIHKGRFRGLALVFGMIVVSHPVWAEQFYFTLQAAEIMLSVTLLAVSLLAAHRWGQRGGFLWFAAAVLPATLVFGTYQAMMPLYIFTGAALSFLRSAGKWAEKADREEMPENKGVKDKKETPEKEKITGKNGRSTNGDVIYVFRLAVVFLTGFAVNQVITALFFSKTGYVSDQVQWGNGNFKYGFMQILMHIKDVLTGDGIFYIGTFAWIALCLLFALLIVFRGRKEKLQKIWLLFLSAAVCAGPFYLTAVMGKVPVARAQLVLPFCMGFMAYMSGALLDGSKAFAGGRIKRRTAGLAITAVLISVCALSVWKEAEITSRLYYTDSERYEEDLRLADTISRDIAEFTGEYDFSGTVIFVGKREAAGNNSTVEGDVIGHSIFAWDTDVEPAYYYSSLRILGFMHCMGMRYDRLTADQAVKAAEAASDMSCYPKEGSIAWMEDTVVVKLSD